MPASPLARGGGAAALGLLVREGVFFLRARPRTKLGSDRPPVGRRRPSSSRAPISKRRWGCHCATIGGKETGLLPRTYWREEEKLQTRPRQHKKKGLSPCDRWRGGDGAAVARSLVGGAWAATICLSTG